MGTAGAAVHCAPFGQLGQPGAMPSESAASVSQVMLAALRVACAELAIDVGYMRTHQSSLDTLSEIAARYIAEIAVNARSNAQ